MPNDLSKLPPPPTGQQGLTLDAFKHLPPPPAGQQGFTLDQINQQSTQPTTQPTPQANPIMSTISDIGQGIGKAAASTVTAVGEMGRKIQSALPAPLQGLGTEGTPAQSQTGAFDQGSQTNTELTKSNEPTNLAQGVGSFIGTVAPYFTGVGEAEAGAKLAASVPEIAAKLGVSADTLVPKIASFIAQHAPAATKNFLIGTAQTGSPTEGAKVAAAGEVANGVASGFGKILQASGNKIINSVIKPSQADIKDGFSMNTVNKFNLGGSLSTVFNKTETKLDSLTKQLNDKLASSNAVVDLNKIYQDTANKLDSSQKSNFGSTGSIGNALKWLQGEINNVTSHSGDANVSIPDAQIIKRATGHYGAWSYGAPDPETTARQAVANTFYNQLKTSIEKNSPDGVKEINKQMSELIPVMNAVIRRIPIAQRNNAISLGDIIGLSTAHLNPAAIPFTVLNFLTRQGAFGQALNKTGQAVQKVAPAIGNIGAGATASGQSQSTTSQ